MFHTIIEGLHTIILSAQIDICFPIYSEVDWRKWTLKKRKQPPTKLTSLAVDITLCIAWKCRVKLEKRPPVFIGFFI